MKPALLALFILHMLLLATPARAFSDCHTPAFAAFMEDAKFVCSEGAVSSVDGFGGSVNLRSVRQADDALASAAEAKVMPAVAEALRRMAAIKAGMALQISDVTVALAREGATASQDGAIEKVLGIASMFEGECVLELYPARLLKSAKTSDDDLLFVLAHELFHCVQYATWPDLMADYSKYNWIVEGTAETVGQAVYPSVTEALRQAHRFSDRFRDVPLTQLTYENVVFFSWVWAQDPALVFKLLSAMPIGGNEAAQQQALLGVIPADSLSQFVRDFIDNTIATPGSDDPAFGEIALLMDTNIGAVQFDSSGTRDLATKPFAMFALDAEFRGASYAIDVADKGQVMTRHRQMQAVTGSADLAAGGDWGSGPIAAAGDCASSVTYRLAGIATGDAKVWVTAKAEGDTSKCTACSVTAAMDQCLVGTWLIDNVVMGQSISSILGQGRPVGVAVSGKNAIIFNPGGTSTWGYQNFDLGVRDSLAGTPAVAARLNGTIDQRWSTAGDRLTTCFTSANATIRIGVPGAAGDPVNFNDIPGPKPDEHYAYRCEGSDRLLLERDLGGTSFTMDLKRLD